MITRRLSSWTSAIAFSVTSATASAAVTVDVDAGRTHQTIEGFGATTIPLVYGATDNVPPALRADAIAAAYGDVHLNMGNLEPEPFESPPSNVYAPANDDSDPFNLNANGFNWIQSDNLVDKIVTPAAPYGFDNYYLGPVAGTGFSLSWVNDLRTGDYTTFLDEIAEHVVAIVTRWRDAYGITPRYFQLWNEPLSGNGELVGGSPQELVDIVKRAGARLESAGFSMHFVVPAEETESISLEHASLILADPEARPYVGAIAYHPYPYGSTYASVPNILSTSGSGSPDAQAVAARNGLRDLGAQYGIPVFMVEVSHSELSFDDFNGVRGRAIQIHDELEYADAAAFFGMNALWDSTSHAQHYAGRADPGFYSETDTIVLIDNDAGEVHISPMGHAIGHFARAIRRGALRLDATSDDALLQVTAFRDDAQGRFVLVVINNATAERAVNVSLAGLSLTGSLSAEQSTAASIWTPLSEMPIAQGSAFTVTVPAESVTTYWAPILGADIEAGAPSLDAGASGSGGSASGSGASGGGGGSSGSTSSAGAVDGATTSGGAPGTAGNNVADVAPDAGNESQAASSKNSSGCGCRVTSRPRRLDALIAVVCAAFVSVRRRWERRRGQKRWYLPCRVTLAAGRALRSPQTQTVRTRP